MSIEERIGVDKINNIIDKIYNEQNYYYEHKRYGNIDSDNLDKTVSIVMTTHNRIKQTMHTLKTIQDSDYKYKHVVLVDDSDRGYITELDNFNYCIDYIIINKKDWTNPCVNYNIGFKYVEGNFIIIQNSEVCHLGPVIQTVVNNSNDTNYLVFNVVNTGSIQNNDLFYDNMNINRFQLELMVKQKKMQWYQHQIFRPGNYHFLVAIKRSNFDKLGMGFDMDFATGRWFDDNELVFRITLVMKLNVVNINLDPLTMGIHLHHESSVPNIPKHEMDMSIDQNKTLYHHKKRIFYRTGNWPFFSKSNIKQ